MFLMNWIRQFDGQGRRHKHSRSLVRKNPIGHRRRLVAERLEDRRVLSSLTVTGIGDAVDVADGVTTLREAIGDANVTPGADAIVFDTSLVGATITLAGTALAISDDLAITGLGAAQLTIDGNNATGVFSIDAGVTVAISDLRIARGSASNGGAVRNEGMLSVTDAVLSNNRASDYGGTIANLGQLMLADSTLTNNWAAFGGVIANREGGLVTLSGSSFTQNIATDTGGAVENSDLGALDVTDSIFSANSANKGGAIWNRGPSTISNSALNGNSANWWGGAIAKGLATMTIAGSTLSENWSGTSGGSIDNSLWATLFIEGSTIFDNATDYVGGTIENFGSSTLELTSTTFSGNHAGRSGGAIRNWSSTLRTTNSTIILNRSDTDGNGVGNGGGIYNSSAALLNNTIDAGNLLGLTESDSANDIAGDGVDADSAHNLIGDAATGGGLTDGVSGNILGVYGSGIINLGAVLDTNLADKGGPTLTHALVPGSPALNAGDNDQAVDAEGLPLAYDQRGDGFARICGGTVDIGALEVQPQTVQIDVKPGGDPNSINLASNGVIAVAILTTDDFDATTVDAGLVVFAGATAVHNTLEDVDGDGDFDLVLHF